MTTISAKVVLSSVNKQTGDMLTTFLLRYPRFIHSELMTHRAFSRNAASSRAIPVAKLLDEALNDPALPVHWFKNEPGMQGRVPMEGTELQEAKLHMDLARLEAINRARATSETGAHKQIVNRILEPYIHITTLVSATEWENFFELRDHKDAEPHFRDLAHEMRIQYQNKTLQVLEPGGWHLPFVEVKEPRQPELRDIKMSVACCASTSYKTVDGFEMTQEKAGRICQRLMTKPLHASPLEHVAQADSLWNGNYLNPTSQRNFRGFIQLRARIELGDYSAERLAK